MEIPPKDMKKEGQKPYNHSTQYFCEGHIPDQGTCSGWMGTLVQGGTCLSTRAGKTEPRHCITMQEYGPRVTNLLTFQEKLEMRLFT